MTILHRAVETNDIELVKTLLTKGADANQVEGWSMPVTPLYYAIKKNNLELTKMLLDHGAKPLFRGYSYLPLAILQATLYKQTPEFKAINYQIVELLLDKGADVNLFNSDGTNQALSNALSMYPSLPLFILLLNKGAIIAQNEYGLVEVIRRDNSSDKHLTKLIIIVVLSRDQSIEKPKFLEKYKILSDYWDEVKGKIDYLNKDPVLGKDQTQKVIKECEFLKNSLKGLSLNRFFKANVEATDEIRFEPKFQIFAA